jgi:hypothetical protein
MPTDRKPLIGVPGGEVEIILRGSAVPEVRREFLLERINAIIATNWRSTRPHWSREHSPFHDDYGMAFFHKDSKIIGYFIYKRLTLDGIPVFYGAGTAVLSSYQGEGCYQMMHRHALDAEWRAMSPEVSEIYFAWRTRNLAIWISCSRACKMVTPSLWDGREDPKLQDACLRLAREIYPDCPIEPPAMIMRNAFDHLTDIRRPKRRPTRPISARFSEVLANPADAIFSVGIVERSTWSASMKLSRLRK